MWNAEVAATVLTAMRRPVLEGDRRVPHQVIARLDAMVQRWWEARDEALALTDERDGRARLLCLEAALEELRVQVEILKSPDDVLALQALDGMELVRNDVEACALGPDHFLHAPDLDRDDGGSAPEAARLIAGAVVPAYAHVYGPLESHREALLSLVRSDAPAGVRTRALHAALIRMDHEEALRTLAAAGPLCDTSPAHRIVCSRMRGNALIRLGRDEEGREVLEEALDPSRRLLGDSHPYVGNLQHALARIAIRAGDVPAAESRLDDALSGVAGEDDWRVGYMLETLAEASRADDDLSAAESHERAALRVLVLQQGRRSIHVAQTESDLSAILLQLGQTDDAVQVASRASAAVAPLGQAEPDWVARIVCGEGTARLAQAGVATDREIIEPFDLVTRPDDPDLLGGLDAFERAAALHPVEPSSIVESAFGRGIALLHLGRTAEARGAFQVGVAGARQVGNAWEEALLLHSSGRAALAAGDAEAAASSFSAALVRIEGQPGFGWVVALTHYALWRTLLELDRPAEARAHLDQGLAIMRESFDPSFFARVEMEAAMETQR